jgi:hypothetical protein
MNNIPYGFLSPLLAQKKLLENFHRPQQTVQNCVKMDVNPCKDTMTNISTIPQLCRDLAVSDERDHNIPIQNLRDLLVRASKRAYEKELDSERGCQTISKAIRYNIPFDENDIDFLGLMDEISDYEFLLKIAAELDIDWEESNYDIAGLEEVILVAKSDSERQLCNDNRQFRSDYYASICLRG